MNILSNAARFTAELVVPQIIVVDDPIIALGQLAAYHRRQLAADVIAVTGSNGKTTTKAMIAHLLSASRKGRAAERSYNNAIGVPLTMLSAGTEDEFLVVEIGSNAPGEIDRLSSMAQPDIAVITSIGPAHLEGLGDVQGVITEKFAVLDHLNPGGMAVVNIDEPVVRDRLHRSYDFNLVTTGFEASADLRAADVRTSGISIAFSINGHCAVEMTIPGRHNAGNALAGYAVARRLGITTEQIVERLSTFKLPEQRLQMIQHGSITIISDCYNANPASVRTAIDVISSMDAPGRRVAIIGDMRELGHHSRPLHQELGRMIAASGVDVLVSVGEYADIVCASAGAARPRGLEMHASKTVDQLSRRITTLLKPQDIVLLKASRALKLERLVGEIESVGSMIRPTSF